MVNRGAKSASLGLRTSYGYHARSTHRAFDRLLERHLRKHGIKNGYWYFLRVLWEREGLTQRELSNEINLMESSTVIMLKEMEAAGLIHKLRCEQDRRKLKVYLTPQAKRLKKVLLPYAQKINQLAAADIPAADLATFLKVAEQMKCNLLAADKAGES
jgi:DNA-binding MarR family transcriptional regulator